MFLNLSISAYFNSGDVAKDIAITNLCNALYVLGVTRLNVRGRSQCIKKFDSSSALKLFMCCAISRGYLPHSFGERIRDISAPNCIHSFADISPSCPSSTVSFEERPVDEPT